MGQEREKENRLDKPTEFLMELYNAPEKDRELARELAQWLLAAPTGVFEKYLSGDEAIVCLFHTEFNKMLKYRPKSNRRKREKLSCNKNNRRK